MELLQHTCSKAEEYLKRPELERDEIGLALLIFSIVEMRDQLVANDN